MTETGCLLAGRYRLDRRIATGGMGVVWAATDELLDRPVAIKVVKPEYADDAAFRERLQAEARAAASVHDRHVVAIYDVGEIEEDGRVDSFIVMELLAGRSLAEELATGPLPPARVAAMLADVGTALAAAHACGVVHRDIKPANIMVEPSGRFVVLDFGIARAASAASLTQTGIILGTARYLSPEQAAAKPAVPASDVYSLGIVAHQCLAGAPPFDAESDVAVALAHLHDPPPALPDEIPQPLSELVGRCLAKDPADRPTAAQLAATARSLVSLPQQAAVTGPPAATRVLPAAELAAAGAGAAFATEALTGAGGAADAGVAGGTTGPKGRTPAWLTSKWIAAGALAGLLLIAVGTAIGLAGNSGGGNAPAAHPPASHTSTVADSTVRVDAARYTGLTWTQAADALRKLGLRPVRRSVTGPADRVVSLSPTGRVAEGSRVVVSVGAAPPPVVVHHPAPHHEPKPPGPKPPKDNHGHGPGHGDHGD